MVEDYTKAEAYRRYRKTRKLMGFRASAMTANHVRAADEVRQRRLDALEEQYPDFKEAYDAHENT